MSLPVDTIRECDLAKPVADWLRANGYPIVYAEVGRGPVDLVGWNEAEGRIACVELKRSLTLKVLKQASYHQVATVDSYVAVGTKPRHTSISKAQEYGLGVLSVHSNQVFVRLRPKSKFEPYTPYRDELLDCLRHSLPSDSGGVPDLKGVGPAQDCARSVRQYLGQHPETAWRQIFTDVPNHYSNYRSLAQVMNHRFGIFIR